MTTQAAYDPFQDAQEAKPSAGNGEYYGQVECKVYPCVLVKGVGKMPFDPNTNKESERRTAVDIFILPPAELNLNFSLERRMVAQSNEWAKIVWPSLKDLGLLDLRQLNGKYCKVTMQGTGRKYEKEGEQKEATTFKFLALYPTEPEMLAAMHNGNGTQPAAAQAPAVDKNREVALKFLPTMIKQWCAKGLDPEAVRAGLAGNPLLAKYFTVESPEVVELMMAQVPA
jgi:hypothetical protein